MKSNDYVKFLTQTVLEHFETPKEERKRLKQERRELKEPVTYRYFGTMPLLVKEGVRMAYKKYVKGKRKVEG